MKICQNDTARKVAPRASALKLPAILPISNVAQTVNLASGQRVLQAVALTVQAFRLTGKMRDSRLPL